MKILIEIDCESVFEFKSHLKALLSQISQERNRLKMKLEDDFPKGFVFEDDNCYGSHYAIVKE